jgi:hypothetical protein
MTARERLNQASFDSLESMMAAFAAQAVVTAAEEHRQRLDYSGSSVENLELILAASASPQPDDQEYFTRLWGSYFGEVLRREFGGEWMMSVYPGGALSIPTLEIQGSRLYPLLKVFRRLTLGEGENILNFYKLVRQRLAEPEKAQ